MGTYLCLYCWVKKNGQTSADQPLGRNTCARMVKEIGEECGIVDMKGFKPHCFRSYFLTYLANDPSLNLSEVMAAGRHTSVSASLAYQRRSGKSEAAKFDVVEKVLKRGIDDGDEHGCKKKDGVSPIGNEKKKMKMSDSSISDIATAAVI